MAQKKRCCFGKLNKKLAEKSFMCDNSKLSFAYSEKQRGKKFLVTRIRIISSYLE